MESRVSLINRDNLQTLTKKYYENNENWSIS